MNVKFVKFLIDEKIFLDPLYYLLDHVVELG